MKIPFASIEELIGTFVSSWKQNPEIQHILTQQSLPIHSVIPNMPEKFKQVNISRRLFELEWQQELRSHIQQQTDRQEILNLTDWFIQALRSLNNPIHGLIFDFH